MAFEVTRVYREHYPALRFIGDRYTNADRGADGGYGGQWSMWWRENRFDALKAGAGAPQDESTIGLMVMRGDGSDFSYWIGLFFPAGTAVPEGFDSIDLPESDIGVGWVRGSDENGEIFGAPPHEAACHRLIEEGMGDFRDDIMGEGSGMYCFFELYNCPRFTQKDSEGKVTLDYGNYIR